MLCLVLLAALASIQIQTGKFAGLQMRLLPLHATSHLPLNISGTQFLLISNDLGCEPITNESLVGYFANQIVLIPSVSPIICTFNTYLANWADTGAIAVVVSSTEPVPVDLTANKIFQYDNSALRIPAFFIEAYNQDDFAQYIRDASDSNVTVSISYDPVWFNHHIWVVILLQVILLCWAFVCAVLSLKVLYKYIRIAFSVRRFNIFALPIVALLFEFLGSIVRFAMWLDIAFTYGILVHEAWATLITLPVPFVVSTTILISFYWSSVLRESKRSRNLIPGLNNKRFMVPAVIVIVLMFIAEITQNVLRVSGIASSRSVVIFVVVFYLLAFIGLITFYLVTGIRILRLLFGTRLRRIQRQQIRLASMMLVSSFASLLWIIGTGLSSSSLYEKPLGYLICMALIFIGESILSSVQIIAFQSSDIAAHNSNSHNSDSTARSGRTTMDSASTDDMPRKHKKRGSDDEKDSKGSRGSEAVTPKKTESEEDDGEQERDEEQERKRDEYSASDGEELQTQSESV